MATYDCADGEGDSMNTPKVNTWLRQAEGAEVSERIQASDATYWEKEGNDRVAQSCHDAREVYAAIAAFCRSELKKEQAK